MLLMSPSDLAPNGIGLKSEWQARWGRENCIIWGRTRHADFGPQSHTLSIRAVWGGVEHCHVKGRTIAVDDDNFLILNHGQVYATSIRAERPVESLIICFRPELVERIHDEASSALEHRQRRDVPAEGPLSFFENLQPHGPIVTPVLRFIRAHLARGVTDAAWYDEQLRFLLSRMRSHHEKLLELVDSLALVRRGTRREVYRRVALARDYLHTYYDQNIDLDTLANSAYLSKYHFLRVFTLVHGVTPCTYLQRKRVTVAARLLRSTDMTAGEVAASVGFADESTLGRQLRRWLKVTARQIRATQTRTHLPASAKRSAGA